VQHIESEGIVAYIHVETKEQEINELLKQEETMWKQQPIVMWLKESEIFSLKGQSFYYSSFF
jgi:hypothetical protein